MQHPLPCCTNVSPIQAQIAEKTDQPSSNIINECRPSMSSIEAKSARIAPFNSSRISVSCSLSSDLTKGVRTDDNRLLRALPATVTKAPSARALNAVIGSFVKVGNNVGNTVDARTWRRKKN